MLQDVFKCVLHASTICAQEGVFECGVVVCVATCVAVCVECVRDPHSRTRVRIMCCSCVAVSFVVSVAVSVEFAIVSRARTQFRIAHHELALICELNEACHELALVRTNPHELAFQGDPLTHEHTRTLLHTAYARIVVE